MKIILMCVECDKKYEEETDSLSNIKSGVCPKCGEELFINEIIFDEPQDTTPLGPSYLGCGRAG